jgi:hypothetical protein
MTGENLTRWLFAATFGCLWLACAASNFASYARAWRRGETTSLTLFIGGAAGLIATLACPIPGLWVWCWVPPLLDVGSLPALAMMIAASKKQRPNPDEPPDPKA